MGIIYSDIKLINLKDIYLSNEKIIDNNEIHSYFGKGLVDTGSSYLVIPESIYNELELGIKSKSDVEIANGNLIEVSVTEPIRVEIMGRTTTVEAIIMGNEILLVIT